MKRIARIPALALLLAVLLGAVSAPDAPVADAAERGDLETVRTLLRGGADVNAPQGDGMTALHWAADRGNAELARMLVFAGADVEAGTRIGSYTPLHMASRLARAGVVAVLLEAGADPMARASNTGATPVHLAAASGDAAILQALLGAGGEPDVREGAWGQAPLIFAAANDRVEAIQVLLDAGADPDGAARSVDVREWADADRAAAERLTEALESFKEREGGGPDWQPTPSQVQAAIELSREIQRRWPDVPQDDEAAEEDEGEENEGEEDAPTEEGEGEEEATEDDAGADEPPVEAGEDSDEEKSSGEAYEEEEEESTLSYAEMVERWGGLTPLLHAVRQGHERAATALLAGGADIDATSADGTTPLMMATLNGHWDLATKLLDAGADPNVATIAGATPLYAVVERQWEPKASYSHPVAYQQQQTTHLEMMEALLEAGADPDVRLNRHLWYMEYTFSVLGGSGIYVKGATPFWRAAYALDVDAMALLTEYGADPDIATVKPAERRRPPDDPDEEEEGEEDAALEASEEAAAEGEDAPDEAHEEEAAPEEPAEEQEAEEQEAEEQEAQEDEEEEDHSGLAPIPAGGPHIYPIHAATGVGYGQSFAGNAHRYVPDGWMDAVRFLVEEVGADVNQRDANGYTPLHHAAARGDDEMIRLLVALGADVTAVSRSGQTTADMANGPVQRVQPFPSTVELLESLGSENNHNCVSC